MSLYIVYEDHFTGTAGTSFLGRVPDTVQCGTDVYTADEGVPFVVASGGGAIAPSGGGGSGFAAVPLTGVGPDQTATVTFSMTALTQALHLQMRRNGGSSYNIIEVILDTAANTYTIQKYIATTRTVVKSGVYTFATGTTYTMVVGLVSSGGSTTVSFSMNGTLVDTATISDAAVQVSGFYNLGVTNGTPGDLKFLTSQVTVAGPTTGTLSGPSTGSAGVASSNFTATLGSAVPAGGQGLALTLADSAGGATFGGTGVTGTKLVIPSGSTTGTFTDTRASAATGNVSAAYTGITFTPASVAYTTNPAGPTTGTFAGPTSGSVSSPSSNFTVTLGSAAPTGGSSVILSDAGAGGTFTPTSLTIAAGQTVGTFTYRRTTAGTSVITPTLPGCTFTPATISYVAASGPATAFTITGPTSGTIGVDSSPFSVTPNGLETGTFTPTPVVGVTFTPSSLTWSGDASSKTFTINKATAGTVSISGTFSNNLTPPSSVSYTFVAVSTDVTYLSSLYGVPTGVTPTAVVKNAAGATVTPSSGGTVIAQGAGAFSMSFAAPAGLYLVAWTVSGTVVLDNVVAVGGAAGGTSIDPLSLPLGSYLTGSAGDALYKTHAAVTNSAISLSVDTLSGTMSVYPPGAPHIGAPLYTIALSRPNTAAPFTFSPAQVN